MADFNNIGTVTYTDGVIADLTKISNKIEEIKPEPNPNQIQPELFDNFHNFYINFFNYLKYFLSNITVVNSRNNENQKIKFFSFNYGSKILSSKNYQENESFEYPYAKININEIRPVQNTNRISRQLIKHIETDINTVVLATNHSKKEFISCNIDQNFINLSIEIVFEDSAAVLDFQNILLNTIPLNFSVYSPKYNNYINITDYVKDWKLDNQDDITGVITLPSNTYLDKDYNYGILITEPILELTSSTISVDKESMNSTLNLDFIINIQQPHVVSKHKFYSYQKIEVDINTSTNSGIIDNTLPLLTRIDDEGIKGLNISKVIQLTSENFIETLDQSKYSMITFYSDTDIENSHVSIWSIKDKSINQGINHGINQGNELYYPIDYLIANIDNIIIDTSLNIDEQLNIIKDEAKNKNYFGKVKIDNKNFYIINVIVDPIIKYFNSKILILDNL